MWPFGETNEDSKLAEEIVKSQGDADGRTGKPLFESPHSRSIKKRLGLEVGTNYTIHFVLDRMLDRIEALEAKRDG